jgi:BirA family biotin operon repressor/biotin-[acetyl-CoA-carboxylase] ligase
LTRIRVVERTGSTNADLLADPSVIEGDWLVALKQDAGRGRQGREWMSEDGNFFGSTLVSLRPADPSAASLSLAAGLALIEAVDLAAPNLPLMLKWPNDLLLGTAKLGGILLERNGDRVVAGFGLNLGKAPKIEGRDVAALNGVMLPQAFAPLLAGSFARLLGLWRSSEPDAFAKAWLARAHPVGTRLTIHSSPGETTSGRFEGIEPDGALMLRREDGDIDIVRAGDVEL